jgi:ribosomal protein S18 acetylase RimI-like enzyme
MKKTDFNIRKAELNDLWGIQKLNQDLFNHDFNFDKTLDLKWPTKNEDYYKKRIKEEKSIAFVAEYEKKIIGYLIGCIKKPEDYRTVKLIAELENMLIEESYRKKGIGKMLINNFIKWVKENKINRIKVSVYDKNTNAIEFYKKTGFTNYSLTLEGEIK